MDGVQNQYPPFGISLPQLFHNVECPGCHGKNVSRVVGLPARSF